MKIIETLVRRAPRVENGRLRVSTDTDVWENVDNLNILRRFCVDRFGGEISADSADTGYQLRSKDVLRDDDEDVFVAFLAVPEIFYSCLVDDRREYCVPAAIYSAIESSLRLIGYDVCDFLMISAFEHGSSPYFGGFGHFGMLNKYGLFTHHSDALDCATENDRCAPEHRPWQAVEIYVTDATLRKMDLLLADQSKPA